MRPTLIPPLSPLEARILAVLVEKQHTVPDSYPLTLNSLVLGCNQKNNRQPVTETSEAEVQASLVTLNHLGFVSETTGGRATRYTQNLEAILGLSPEAVSLLATLILRGGQTMAQLRQNASRLHLFADQAEIDRVFTELIDLEKRERPEGKTLGPLSREMPRIPGTRETRWEHTLSDQPVLLGPEPAVEILKVEPGIQPPPADHPGTVTSSERSQVLDPSQNPPPFQDRRDKLPHILSSLERLEGEMRLLRETMEQILTWMQR